jgi:hypothetical protein
MRLSSIASRNSLQKSGIQPLYECQTIQASERSVTTTASVVIYPPGHIFGCASEDHADPVCLPRG